MQGEMEEVVVLIVGAGPAGLATSACLNVLNIPNIVLEKEDCHASLWKKRTYDRLKLHLAKEFCSLPHMPFPPSAPTFVPKNGFVAYLDEYVSHFGINPRCNRLVEYAYYDAEGGSWRVEVKNKSRNAREVYVAQFLVVATGENSEGLIPDVPGLETFGGDYFHSNQYENGKKFSGKNVLVVGTGNSGMEISYDLSNWGAKTSIAVRSPVHVLSKEMVHLAMHLLKFVPVKAVDKLCVLLAKSKYGKLSKYGLPRPKKGPFYLKATTGRSPTIDVGCVKKIKSREIKTFPSIKSIDGNRIEFINGEIDRFDAIVFATGYRSTVGRWLNKNDSRNLFNEDGMPNKSVTNHWKGEKGLYCAGFAQQGLQGISKDAKKISEDINIFVTERKAQDDYEHQVQ